MSIALVTGGSRGLGYALVEGLISTGWSVITNGRDPDMLRLAEQRLRPALGNGADLVAIAGDVTDPRHRAQLADAAFALGGLDVLINNAGILGPSPLPKLVELPSDDMRAVVEANLIAPLALVQDLIGLLRRAPKGRVIMISSDAAITPYPGWGGYGAAKAAVDQLAAVLAVEEPDIRVWVVDPGDLRTDMHQEAFPGEDISDRPEPASVVPGFLALIGSDRPSGRYLCQGLLAETAKPRLSPRTSLRTSSSDAIDFVLPTRLEASSPPEEKGAGRDDVRLMVSSRSTLTTEHRHFRELPELLKSGDLVVVNTSATVPAALRGQIQGHAVLLHLSSPRGPRKWVVELRRHDAAWQASAPLLDAATGTVVALPDHGRAVLIRPVRKGPAEGDVRLWLARLDLPRAHDQYLADHGRPIRYGYVRSDYPIAAYQTVFAEEAGSAEMPSAARPFTAELVTRLVSRGVSITPVLLHTGVSSQEAHEAPLAERFAVSPTSAARINAARRLGGRVIAVGTTVVRALETVVDAHGVVLPGTGWTTLVVSPDRSVRSIDGLITGWHEPHASHLAMIQAVAGRELLEASYRAALDEGYLWHEFGDSQLILP